jgi:hypothetical protein
MINIFFTPGTFGSTVEYVLTSSLHQKYPDVQHIAPDGSMHTIKKQNHPTTMAMLEDFISTNDHDIQISTPIYPFKDAEFFDILGRYPYNPTDKFIVLCIHNIDYAELNILFQYYKLSLHIRRPRGLAIFYPTDSTDFKGWNNNYTCFEDMQFWEIREWFSIYYPTWIKSHMIATTEIPPSFLSVTTHELLENTKETFGKILQFCGRNDIANFHDFLIRWREEQQYIIDKKIQIDRIVDSIVTDGFCEWKITTVIEEAIIQQKLRSHGYEIRCHGLDRFPTNTTDLRDLLYVI